MGGKHVFCGVLGIVLLVKHKTCDVFVIDQCLSFVVASCMLFQFVKMVWFCVLPVFVELQGCDGVGLVDSTLYCTWSELVLLNRLHCRMIP